MSDIGDIRITTSVDTSAATSATEVLNRSLLQLTGQINSYSAAAAKASSVHGTLQRITKGVSDQQKVLTNLVVAYGTAQNTTNRIVENANANLKALDATMAKVGSSSAKMTSALKAQQSQFTAITNNVQALNRALTGASIQQWANKSKQALSLANLSLIRTTAQTLAFTRALRTAFFSFADLEQESARVTKLLVDNFGSGEDAIEKARAATVELGKDLDKITRRFGTSRVLVQSLAGDFAELGISDNAAIAGLVELTTTVEKLGNVDISQSQKFIESMLQNILRVKREQAALKGLSLDLTDPKQFAVIIQELKGQLAEFNLVENKTTLSLKDLADAFPEVSAAATTFGLSMTETSALLAPMVASGFQVGASANSIKVSLQRMVAMTKQNTQIIGGLNEALGPDFDYAAGVSMENIQKLTDGFNSLLNLKGEQGTLELFARLFGVRQGPRMETSIRQFAVFQKALDTTGTTEQRVAKSIEDNVNKRLKAAGMEEMQLKKIVDISKLHRAATEKVNGEYTTRAKIIRFGQEAAFKDLNKQFAVAGESASDFLSKIGTESGKILMSSAFRIEDVAQKQLETELEIGLQTTITQFRILKEEILAIGRVLVSAFGPLIKFFNPIIQKIRDFLEGMGEGGKKLLSFSIIILALLPTLKILGASFRYFYVSAIGGIAKLITGFGKFGSKLISVTDLIDRGDRALKGWQKAIQISPDKILLTGRQRGSIADTTGLSPSLREARAVGATPTISTIKTALRASVGLPVASTAMAGLVTTAGDAAEAAADVARSAGGTLDALTSGVSDALKTGFKGTTFVSNRFLGNTFGGRGTTGAPGTGGRGGGGAPASGGTTTTPSRRVPARPIYGPPVPPPESGPIYGPEFPVDRRPVFGPAAPPDTRPIFGPKLPKVTPPVAPTVTGTSGIPAGGFRIPSVAKITEPIKEAAESATAVATSAAAAVSSVTEGVAAVTSDAAAAISGTASSVRTKTKAAGAAAKKAVGASKKTAALVTLTGHEIATAVRNAGQNLPEEFAFLDNLKTTWQMTEKNKKAVLKQISDFAAAEKAAGRELSSLSGPFGKIKTTGAKGSKIYPSGQGRALVVPEKGGAKSAQARVTQDILAERLARKKPSAREARELTNVIEGLKESRAKAISDAMETVNTGATKGARKAAAKQAQAAKAALAKTVGSVESRLLKTAKYAGLVPNEAIEEITEEIPLITEQIATKEAKLANIVKDLDKARLANNQALVQDLTIKQAAIDKELIEMRTRQARVLRSRAALSKADKVLSEKVVEASPIAKQFTAVKESLAPGSQYAATAGTRGVTQTYLDKTIREKMDNMPILARGGRPGQTVINKMIDSKAAYEAFVLDEIDRINEGIKKFDQDLIDKLERHYRYKMNPKREMDKAVNRQAIEKLARSRVSVGALDAAHPDYNPVEQQRVLGRSRIGQRVADARIQSAKDKVLLNPEYLNQTDELERAAKEAEALKDSLDKTSRQYTDDAVSKRRKLANTFKKQRAALLKNFGSVDKALESLAADVEKAAKLTPGYLSTPSSVTRGALPKAAAPTAASVAAPVVAATGAGAVKTPTGVARVFFSDAVRAASSAVTGATQTIGSEIARLLDDVLVKAIPAGFDPAKAKVIRAVVGEVLAKTPITAASAATPAAQKFMATVLGTMGPDIARVIDTLAPQITEAISAGGISAKGGIIQSAKARTVSAFNKLKGVATAKLVGDVAMLRTGIEAAVFDAIAAAGYAVESTTSSVAEALRSGTFSDAMLPGYLDELTEKRGRRSAAAVGSGARGGAAAAATTAAEKLTIASATELAGLPSLVDDDAIAKAKKLKDKMKKSAGKLVTAGKFASLDEAFAAVEQAFLAGEDAMDDLMRGIGTTRRKGVAAAAAEIADGVKATIEAPVEAVREIAAEVSETVDSTVDAIKKDIGEMIDDSVPTIPSSTTTPKSPVIPGAPATGPPVIDVRKTPIKDIRSGIPAGVDKIGSRTTKEAIDKISALRKEAADITKELSTVTKDVTGLEKAVASSTGRLQKLNQQALDKARNTFKKKTARLIQVNKELDTIQRNIDNALKKVATPAAATTTAATTTGAAATGAAATGAAAGAAPTGARGPRVPGVSIPTTTPAAAVATSAIVEKLDDVIVEFDRSLANFFKGPNFFQGPNYFAGPLTVMPNAKFKDYKKSIKDATPSEKKTRLEALLERARAKRAGLADSAAAAAATGTATGAATAAKAGIMSKIGAALGSGLSKSAGVGLKAVQAGFGIIGKSSAEFFKMSIAFIDMYANALGGASASSKLAAGATKTLALAKAGLNSVAKYTTLALNKASAATIAFGRAIGSTTRAELATFIASLQKSRILKMWGFLLFTGMMPAIKGLKALTIAGIRFMLTLKFGNLLAGFQALYQSILRTTLSVVALGIKLNAAMLMIAPILILVFSIISKVRRGISGMSPAMDNFKAAWFAIKDAIYMLAAPLENMIAAFGGLGNQGNSVKRTAGVVWLLSRGVRAVAEAFQRFAMGPGTKYMQNVVVPIITRLVNRFILLGRAISNTLSGNTARASKDFKGFLYSMLYELIAVIGKFVSILATGLEMFAPTLARMIDAIVAATITAFRKILMFTREVMMLIGAVVGAIGLVTGQIPIALKGAAIAGGGVAFLFLDKQLAKFEESARTGGLGAGEFIANGIASGARGAANGLDKLKNFVGKKYGQEIGRGINDALGVALSKDMPKDVRNAVLKSADDANAGGESLGQQIAKGIKKGLQDLKEEFTDKFFGKADSEVDKFVEKLKEGLENQKEKALEAFDNQVEAIEALAEAEERLTAKIEYEEKRREMIRERALNKENYLRERKVAAYEGRSEDVRSLDLSFRKSSREEEKNLNELDLDRARTLQAENRQNAIKVINKEKENLIKEYEKMFKNFDEKIELIKSRGFSTEAEFRQMFTNLQTAASGFSDDIAGAFEKSMLSLPAAIREHTDASVGMFGMSMDKLVDEAKKSFGVGISSADTVSILGAAYSLVNGMPSAFREGFNQGIVSTYVTPFATKVKGELASIVPADLWVKSAGLAIQEMVNEMKRKLVGLKGTLYDDMKKMFGEMTEEDWNRIFNFSGAFSDLESLKGYFSNLFPTAEKLKKQIVTIETTRSSAESGGSGEKPKAGAGLTPSEVKALTPGNQDMLVRVGKGLVPGPIEPTEDPKKGYFGKLKDIIVGIADYLGPVKTAILGFVGIVAGAATALPIWTAIKGVLVAVAGTVGIIPVLIGTAVGVLIYLYARFKAVRDIVNGVAIAIWDGLVAAFNFVKDLGIEAFDGIKIAFGNLWDGFNNIALPQIKNLWDGFTSGFTIALDFLKDQLVRRWNVIVDIVKSLFGPIKEMWKASLEAGWSIAKNIFENIWNVLKELFLTLKVIFEPIIKIVIGAFVILTEVVTRVMEGLKGPIIGIGTVIAKTFTFLYPIFANIANFIIDVLGGAIVGVLKVIRGVFQGIYAVIGFVVKGLYTSVSVVVSVAAGIAKAIFNILNAIWTNPVVKWIRDFLFRVLMLGIFIVAKLLETFAKTIFNSFKTVFNIFKAVAGFIYDSLKPGLELIWTVIKAVFTPVVEVLKGVWQFIKWIYDEFGILGLILTPFVAAFELIRRALGIAWNVAKAFFETFMVVGRIVFSLVKDLAKAIWDGLGKVWDLISPIVNKFWDGLKIAAEFVWGIIKSVGQGIWDALGWVWDKIGLVAGKFWDGLKAVAQTVWDFLKTVGQGIWDGLGWIWDKIGGVAKAFWEGLKTAAQTVWDFLKTIGEGVWNAIGWVWDKIGGVASGAWDLIKSGAQIAWDFLKTVGEGVWENLGKIWDVISGTAQKLWDVITGGWDQIGPVLEQIWSWLWDGIKWAWDQLSQAVQFYWDLFKQFWGSIEPILSQIWGWLWDGIKWAWDQIAEVLSFYWDLFKRVWGWLQPILSELWDWLWSKIKWVWDQISQALQFYWDLFKKVWDWLGPILKEFMGWLWDKIKVAWENLVTAVQKVWDIIKGMWEVVSPILQKMAELIKNGIGAAIDGVKAAWNLLKDAVSGTFNWFKDKFGAVGEMIRDSIGGAVDWVSDKFNNIPEIFKSVINGVTGAINKVTGFTFTMPSWLKYIGLGSVAGKTYSFRDVIPEIPKLYNGGKVGSYMRGGMAYGYGGMTKGFAQQGIPAVLHGGEYVINHKAVKRIGTDTLDALNNMRLSKPRYPQMPSIPNVTMPNLRIDNSTIAQAPAGSSTQNVNIYVDTFVGEPEWFNSMMKEYNTRVLPRNQKAAGLENRVIRTYNGLNRGG